MMAQNQEDNLIALLNLKGNILVYKVISPDYPTINSVAHQYDASLAAILRYENAESQLSGGTPTSVQTLSFNSLGHLQVHLTNGSRYAYDHVNLKQWKALPSHVDSDDHKDSNPVRVQPALGRFESSNVGILNHDTAVQKDQL